MSADNHCRWCGRKYDSFKVQPRIAAIFVANVVR